MSAIKRLNLAKVENNKDLHLSIAQKQTDQAFGFKWKKRDTYDSSASKRNMRQWLVERYCSGDLSVLHEWLQGERKIILDAGCGAGFSGLLFFGDFLHHHDYLGIDISSAVEVAKQRFEEDGKPGDFIRADISSLEIPNSSIDMIFSEGVLHHTDSTEYTLKHLAAKLVKGGRFLFYVYKKKSLIREYTDDAIREALRPLDDEAAWDALKPLTRLGITLGRLNKQIEIEENIPFLEIKAGVFDLQRFFYWNICKAYYRPELSFDEMHHINFDWFRPMNCHRHTVEELKQWCDEAGMNIEHIDVQESGITIVAIRR